MTESLATALVLGLGIYLAIGLVVAVPFVFRAARKLDPMAAQGTWGFRLAILPATVALWPLALRRWIRGGPPPEERNEHRLRARRGAGS